MDQTNRLRARPRQVHLLDRLRILQAEELQLEAGIASEADDLKSSEEGDRAYAMAGLESSFALRRALYVSKLRALRAIERADSGSYGLCEDCGVGIPAERLEICPEATRCVRCQRLWEFGPGPFAA